MTSPAQTETTKQVMLTSSLYIALFWMARTTGVVSNALDNYEPFIIGSLPARLANRERCLQVLESAQERTYVVTACLMACCLALGIYTLAIKDTSARIVGAGLVAATIWSAAFGTVV